MSLLFMLCKLIRGVEKLLLVEHQQASPYSIFRSVNNLELTVIIFFPVQIQLQIVTKLGGLEMTKMAIQVPVRHILTSNGAPRKATTEQNGRPVGGVLKIMLMLKENLR